MKKFTCIKVGYRAGVYGCIEEVYTLIYLTDTNEGAIHFSGLYGADDRVEAIFKEEGFKEFYINSFYGRMTREDKRGGVIGEHVAIEEAKRIVAELEGK